MRKVFIVLLLLIFGACSVQPTSNGRLTVSVDYVVDGDTFYLIENGERHKYRLLMVDTPECTNEVEPLGKEATDFVKDMFSNAKEITIEYQEDNELLDDYGRRLVWIFVDGMLLQEKLASVGYVEDLYDNGGHYTYKKEVEEALQYAKDKKIGLYE